jgi:alkyl sulfatase BDS1-like metallo-beta-lactamase superfamily hydrolase
MSSRVVQWGGDRVARLDRRPVTHRMIVAAAQRVIPKRFDPEAAGDLEAVLELRVRARDGGDDHRFALTVRGGTCTVRPGAAADAGAAVAVGADDMIRLVSGSVEWPELLAQKRLELSGDPFLALRFPKLFGFAAR